MKVITICGSMLFAGEMKSIAFRLEAKKKVIVYCSRCIVKVSWYRAA